MSMRRRVAPAARTRPMVPVEPTADGTASYSAVQLRRGQRTAHGPSWSRGRRCPAEHAARCRSCGVADGVVNQVGQSDTAHGSSELVKAYTPCRGRPSGRNKLGHPAARARTSLGRQRAILGRVAGGLSEGRTRCALLTVNSIRLRSGHHRLPGIDCRRHLDRRAAALRGSWPVSGPAW
jgi:hypothetical protein